MLDPADGKKADKVLEALEAQKQDVSLVLQQLRDTSQEQQKTLQQLEVKNSELQKGLSQVLGKLGSLSADKGSGLSEADFEKIAVMVAGKVPVETVVQNLASEKNI